MSNYLAFTCKTGSSNNVVILPNDFSGSPDSLLALGPIPVVLIGLSKNSTYQISFTVNSINIVTYFIQNRNIRLPPVPNQPVELTFTNDPTTICAQQVSNPIGVLFKVTGEPPQSFKDQFIVGNEYSVSIGTNPEGNLSVQVIISRSKSSKV